MEIKKLKKLVSILLAAVLVFGVAATGFAAAPEDVVLEEVTAEAAVVPEEEAPVVEEEPVAEVTAVEEEPVADAAAVKTATVTYTVKSKETSAGAADGTPIPGAELNLKYTGTLGTGATLTAANADGTGVKNLTTADAAFGTKSDANGKIVVKYTLTPGTGASTGKINASLSAGTSPLVYPAVLTSAAFDVDYADVGFTNTAAKDIPLAKTDVEIGYKGTISGVVKDAKGNPVTNMLLQVAFNDLTGSAATPKTTYTNGTGAYSFTFDGTESGIGDYDLSPVPPTKYAVTAGEQVKVTLASPAAITNNITVGGQNTVILMNGTTPVAFALVTATGGKTAQTDVNGIADFSAASLTGTPTFTVAGGVWNGVRYYEATGTGSVDAISGNFAPVEIDMVKAPSLKDLTITVPATVNGAIGEKAEITANVTAAGFTDEEFDPENDLAYQWEYNNAGTWTVVTTQCTGNSNEATLQTVTLVAADGSTGTVNAYNTTGAQFRVKVSVKKAGYDSTYVVGGANADFKASSTAMLNVAKGVDVTGALMTGSGATATAIGSTRSNTVTGDAIKIYTPEEFAKGDNKKALATTNSGPNGSYTFNKLIPGNYVVEVVEIPLKDKLGNDVNVFWGNSEPFKQYNANVTQNITVTAADVIAGSKRIDNFYLTPKDAYTFTTQPYSVSVSGVAPATKTIGFAGYSNWGSSASTRYTKTPANGITYQWQVWGSTSGKWTDISGATGATYAASVPDGKTSAKYRAVATVGTTEVYSNEATVTLASYVAPTILANPDNADVIVDRATSFNAVYTNSKTVTEKWEMSTDNGAIWFAVPVGNGVYTKTDETEDGITSCTLNIAQSNIKENWNGYQYRLSISEGTGDTDKSATSAAAKLNVSTTVVPLTFTSGPQDTAAVKGRYPKFSVSVAGTLPFTAALYTDSGTGGITWTADSYWADPKTNSPYSYFNDVTLTSTKAADTVAKVGWQYKVIVTDLDGKAVTSSIAKLTEITAPVKVSIAADPTDQSVVLNRDAMFKVDLAGSAPFTYQWQWTLTPEKESTWTTSGIPAGEPDTPSAVVYPDSTDDSEIIYSFKADDKANMDKKYFRVVVTDMEGNKATSKGAKLTVTDIVAPSITTQPASQTVAVGATATFDVEAGGSGPFTYQWLMAGSDGVWTAIPGAVAQSYTTPALTLKDNMTQYMVIVTSQEGETVESDIAKLTVSDPVAGAYISGVDSLYIGDEVKFDVVVDPASAEFVYDFYISDSNKDKASITGDGVLTAKAQGILKVYAEITGADGERIVVYKKIAIKKATTSFSLKSKENRTVLYKGGSGLAKYPWHTQLILTGVKPTGASSSVKDMEWRSSNPKVATVVNGKVKVASGAGTKLGTVIITATDKGNPNSIATFELKVVKADAVG